MAARWECHTGCGGREKEKEGKIAQRVANYTIIIQANQQIKESQCSSIIIKGFGAIFSLSLSLLRKDDVNDYRNHNNNNDLLLVT